MNIKGMLDKKVGGVPVVYIAAGAVAILAVVAWRMKPAPDATEADAEGSDTTGDDDPYGGLATTGTVIAAPSSTVTAPPAIETNEQWAREGAQYLLSKKLTSPGNALTVTTKYINGAVLTYEESGLKDRVIEGIGYPPEPLAGTSPVLAHIARRQFTSFPGQHTVTGPADNSFSKLAALYYGTTSPRAIVALTSNNPTLGTGTLSVGTTVSINAVPGLSMPVGSSIRGPSDQPIPSSNRG